MNTRLAPHLLVLVTIISEIVEWSVAWKMQLCIRGSTITILDQDCPFGVWLSQPWDISAACFDGGIWAVYNEWCQEKPVIWTVHPGTKGCMRRSILKQVTGIVYLGPEKTGAIMSTKKHKLFLTSSQVSEKGSNFNKTKPNSKRNMKESEVDILVWGKGLFSAHLLPTSSSSLNVVNSNLEIHKCLLKGRHTYSASYSFPLKFRHNITLKVDQGSCISQNTHRWESNQLLPTNLNSNIIMTSSAAESQNSEFHCTPKNLTFNNKIRSRTFKRNVENINYMTYSRTKDLLTPVSTQRINEQTERIARKLIAHVFIEEPLPPMEFAEWKFLLMAQEIFDTACPHELVSKKFFEHIVIFYRFLLLESFDKFPPNIDRDEESRGRIETNLKRCLANATPIRFKGYSSCSTGSEPLVAEYTHSNGTVEDVVVQIPLKVKLDTEIFDVILESTWKLMIFVHYYCADYFKDYPQDLSTLHHRWQELMAPDLLTRWQCPGKSFDMIKTLVRTVDLSRTLLHLDHCVAASHMYSAYSGWVKRPVPLQDNVRRVPSPPPPSSLNSGTHTSLWTFGKSGFNYYTSPMGSTFPEEEWDGVTHCMSDYEYPSRILGYSLDKCGVE